MQCRPRGPEGVERLVIPAQAGIQHLRAGMWTGCDNCIAMGIHYTRQNALQTSTPIVLSTKGRCHA